MAEAYEQSPAWQRLNEKQRAFVREFCIDFNATQAAVRAGYSKSTARQQGSRLLSNVDVEEAVSLAATARAQRTNSTADRVERELERIAFQDIRNVLTFRSVKVSAVEETDDDDSDRDEEDRHVISRAFGRSGTPPKTSKKGALEEAEDEAEALHLVDLRLRDSDQLDDATAATIQSIQSDGKGGVKIKFHSKQAALDTLARRHGLLRPNPEDVAESAEALIALLDARRDRARGRGGEEGQDQGRQQRRIPQRPQRSKDYNPNRNA